MKLLICTQSIDPKDHVAGFFAAWVQEFAKHCEKVTVIALSGIGAELMPHNVRVCSLEKELSANKFRQLCLFYRYVISERYNYDAVFVHNVGPKFILLGAPLWKLWGKRISLWYVHRQVDWKLRLAEKIVDVIFSSAPEAFRIKSSKVHFLGHGIDTEALGALMFAPDPEVFTILQVGRITPIKHCEILVRAAALLKEKYDKPFRVLFVGTPLAEGDAEYLAALKSEIAELHLEEEVVFEGGVPPEKLRDYYVRANVTINMLPTGGMDKVVLEAAAAGVPVFTTNQTFNAVFGDLAERFVLPELNEKSVAELSAALYRLTREGVSESIHSTLKEKVAAVASLPILIKKILNILYGKTSK